MVTEIVRTIDRIDLNFKKCAVWKMATSLDKICVPKQNIELDADKTEVITVL
jgi:hypothetical protein